MARLPKITVQGWTQDGPAYTIHHPVAGFRNRKLRRDGRGGEELVGDHDAIDEELDEPAVYMVLAHGETEVYAFKGGHVYQVTLLVDGDALDVLVDAREGDRLETYGESLQLMEQRALDGDELEAALADEPAQTSGEADDGVTTLTGAQTEEQREDTPLFEEDAASAAASRYPDAGNHETTPADDDESSAGEHDFDGTVSEFTELVEAMDDEELEEYREQDSRKGVREAADRELLRRKAAQRSSGDDEDAAVVDDEPALGEKG